MIAEHDALALGTLEQIRQKLDELARTISAADELGGVERIDELAWNAGDALQADYRGTFKAVAIFNKGPGVLRISLEGVQGARADADASILLRAGDSVTIPYRGSTVYYGGAAAGTATIFYLRTTQPFQASSGAAGQSAAAPTFEDLIDRAARVVGRVSFGIADTLMAGGKLTAPGAGVAICTLAAPPPGKYLVGFRADISATDAGNVELRFGAAVAMPGLGGFGSSWATIVHTLDGGTAISLNATAAGTGGVIYGCSLAATRLE